MNILITGAFGGIGSLVIDEALRRGHQVTAFDVQTRANARIAVKRRSQGVKVILGDIRNGGDIAAAVAGQDVVIHMAAILPPASEKNPDLCRTVNVLGTENLIARLRESPSPPALVEVSSVSVMGPTQNAPPPVSADRVTRASDVYSHSKIDAEAAVRASGLRHCVLRLAAVLPTTLNFTNILKMIGLIFDMPLAARCEIVFDIDVAYALVSAAERLAELDAIDGLVGFIAGGEAQGCQIVVKEMFGGILGSFGLDSLDEGLFAQDLNAYYLDWYDTANTQALFGYQRVSFRQWKSLIVTKYRWALPLIVVFRGFIISFIARRSPRYAVPRK